MPPRELDYSRVAVHLFNEYGDHRIIEVEILDPDHAIQAAEKIAAENNPPPNWPAGLPCGTWRFWKRDHAA